MKWWKNGCIQNLPKTLIFFLGLALLNCATFSSTHEPYEITDETLLAQLPESFPTPKAARNWVINRIDYQEDPDNTWQLPEKTLTDGLGDCEDYALAIAHLIETRVELPPDSPPVLLVSAVGHMWIVIGDLLLDSVSYYTWIKAGKSPGKVYTYAEALEKARNHERAFE